MEDAFEVRLSRLTLLMFFAIGLLFLLAGLEFAFFHRIFDESIGNEKPVLFWAFVILAIAIGLVIGVNIGYYLILPPVMMRISEEGVTFGTGMRYVPKTIPLKYLKSVEIAREESSLVILGHRKTVESAVVLSFEEGEDIPASLATSMGISYFNYRLALSKTYMNRSLRRTADAVNEFIEKRRS